MIESEQIYFTGYRSGFLEANVWHFTQRFISDKVQLGTEAILKIYPINYLDNKTAKCVCISSNGNINLIEIAIHKMSIEINEYTIVKNFHCNTKSFHTKSLKALKLTVCVALNAKGFLILVVSPIIKKVHEINIEQETNKQFIDSACYITELMSKDESIALEFLIWHGGLLKLYYCEFDFENGCRKFLLKKTFAQTYEIVCINKLSSNLVVFITLQHEIFFLDIKTLNIIGKSERFSNIDSVEHINKGFLVRSSVDTQNFYILKSYNYEERITNMLRNSDYIAAMNLALSLKSYHIKDKTQISTLDKDESEETKRINNMVARDYINFILYNQSYAKVTFESFKILFEFLDRTNNMEFISSLNGARESNQLEANFSYLYEALGEFIEERSIFDLNFLRESIKLKIIESFVIKEKSSLILRLLMQNNFNEEDSIDYIMLLCQSIGLKLPLVKLIVSNEDFDYRAMDLLLEIYTKENQLDLFSDLLLHVLEIDKKDGLDAYCLSYEHEVKVAKFILRKNTIEGYKDYSIEYSRMFVQIYVKYFSNLHFPELDFSKVNNSMIYNYFYMKPYTSSHLNIFLYLLENIDFDDVKSAEHIMSTCILKLFEVNRIHFKLLPFDFVDILLNLILQKMNSRKVDKREFEDLLVKFFKKYYNSVDVHEKYFDSFIEKYRKVAHSLRLYKVELTLFDLLGEYESAFNIFIGHRQDIADFDIFFWLKYLYLNKEQSLPASFKTCILKNLSVLVNISKFHTCSLLIVISELKMKDLMYLKDYPELTIAVIQKEMENNNIVPVDLQQLFIQLLIKINPDYLIQPLRKYNFELESTMRLLKEMNYEPGIAILEAKLGNHDKLSGLILKSLRLYCTSQPLEDLKLSQLASLYLFFTEFHHFISNTLDDKLFYKLFADCFRIVNNTVHPNDKYYQNIKLLLYEFFLSILTLVQKESKEFVISNLNYFFDIDVELLDAIFVNNKIEYKYANIVGNIIYEDLRTQGMQLKTNISTGISSSKLVTSESVKKANKFVKKQEMLKKLEKYEFLKANDDSYQRFRIV